MGLSLFRMFMVANAFNIATENPVSFLEKFKFCLYMYATKEECPFCMCDVGEILKGLFNN